ncbi:MAG: sulfurtransferase [Deltaproteobacteria bacterium]|nr:sulfurtransferase [Deltaproteobacteria bacterium]MCB9788730.1 sulfurtransferase [Deltaproteobacteria bacterium]
MDGWELGPDELRALREAGAPILLLDVRTPMEAEICSLGDSVLIPLHELQERHAEVPRDADVVVYCHHGMRSLQAAMFLKQRGVERVRSLAGGIDLWSRTVDPSIPRY